MNRTKVTVACQACQKKKVKCTGSPPCTTCSRSGHKCIFSNNAKKRGPRNGNVEVIRNPANRIESVLQQFPNLRGHIERILECNVNNNNNNNTRRSRNIHSMTQRDQVIVIDDDKINRSGFPYLVPKKSIKQDHIESPIFCKPKPIYPLNMQRNYGKKDDNRYLHNSLLQDSSCSKDLTLPIPSQNISKRKSMSMSIYNSSLGTSLLLPAPDLGNPLDHLQKSLISNPSQRQEGSLNNHNENSLEHGRILADLNEMFKDKDEKKSLPSPTYLSSSSSPKSTSTNYCPPTPTSSSSPPSSPHIQTTASFTSKRSSIHLLSKPVPWCAYDHSLQRNDMEVDFTDNSL